MNLTVQAPLTRCVGWRLIAEYSDPYLLRDLEITRANQVWMVDITYLRTPNGFMYFVALIDVYSRRCWLVPIKHDGHEILY
jgi:transposase InsO family protein